MIELPLISYQKMSLKSIVLLALIAVTVVFMFILKPYWLLFLLATFLLFMSFDNSRGVEQVGILILKNHGIQIIVENFEISIDASEFGDIAMLYSGYRGKNVFISSRQFSGTDNCIIFKHDNKKHKLKYLVYNKSEEHEILKIYKCWTDCGYDLSNFRMNI